MIYYFIYYLSFFCFFSFFHCVSIADDGRADFEIVRLVHTRMQSIENKVPQFGAQPGPQAGPRNGLKMEP